MQERVSTIFGEISKAYLGIIRLQMEILESKPRGGYTMQGKVEICGVNTAKLKTLPPDQMEQLLQKASAGDEEARQALIEGNLRLVLSVIQRFDKRGENPDDLFQVGCIGLMKAIANFDPDKNVRFSTYGVPTVCECRNSKQRSFYYDKKTSPAQCNPAFS